MKIYTKCYHSFNLIDLVDYIPISLMDTFKHIVEFSKVCITITNIETNTRGITVQKFCEKTVDYTFTTCTTVKPFSLKKGHQLKTLCCKEAIPNH